MSRRSGLNRGRPRRRGGTEPAVAIGIVLGATMDADLDAQRRLVLILNGFLCRRKRGD